MQTLPSFPAVGRSKHEQDCKVRHSAFEKGGEYVGTVSGMDQPQTEYGAPTRFLVTLDQGKTVDVSASRMGPFQKGKRVLIREWRSQWFRRTRYTFVRYIESPRSIETLPENE
jgi:hypothetical protein